MRTVDIITKKRNGEELSSTEISYLVNGYVAGQIPDYQISAWLMASYFTGMTAAETSALTWAMIESGEQFDLSSVSAYLVDKHSTGGVGDKTSLIVAPIVAACGLMVPMMSGRSLGHTGGTLDKLDAILGYKSQLTQAEFLTTLSQAGFAMTGQTKEIVPADRLLYALRDVTATIESIPLITASILSKKYAEGAKGFVFDVKFGSGAFMKDQSSALTLAKSLIQTARHLGRDSLALLTDMSFPLGYCVGNYLEVEECLRCLQYHGDGLYKIEWYQGHLKVEGISATLMELSLELASSMLLLSPKYQNRGLAMQACIDALTSGRALQSFASNIEAQGGNFDLLLAQKYTRRARIKHELYADQDGYLTDWNALAVGNAATILGAGRSKLDDQVLADVGIVFHFARTAKVLKDQLIAEVYAEDSDSLAKALPLLTSSVRIEHHKPNQRPVVAQVVYPE